MLGLEGPDEYGIAVCGYMSDLGGKNLQSEWYAIKVPNPDPDQYSPLVSDIQLINPPSAKKSEYSLPDSLKRAEEPWEKKSGRSFPDSLKWTEDRIVERPLEWEKKSGRPDSLKWREARIVERPLKWEKKSGRSLPHIGKSAEEKEKARSAKESEYSLSASEGREGLSSPAKEKEKVKINPPSAKANEKGTIKTEPLHPFSVVRMMYQSRQHAFLEPGGLISLGGLDPVGSDSDGDGAHPFDSERHRKVWSFDVRKPDAGWKAVPPMTFPNRYDPQSVAVLDELFVLGGFSRSQFPTEVAAKGVGWMEAYSSCLGWKCLSNPPSGFSFNDDPFIFTALDGMKILLAQYNHDDLNCDSATFYVYDVGKKDWTRLEPPVRKLLARYPDRTGRRSVAVGNTLYWGLLEDEDINVQAYDLYEDIWFDGSFNVRPVLGKEEYLADNAFPASPPLLHLANQKFCLFLLTSIYDEKNCEVSNPYLNCLILDVSPINDEGDNHQHDYYDHFCYEVHGDVNVDDKEDNANYHVHPHEHFWRLSISIVSIHKYPLVNPIQLLDAVVMKHPMLRLQSPLMSRSMSGLKLQSD